MLAGMATRVTTVIQLATGQSLFWLGWQGWWAALRGEGEGSPWDTGNS